MVSLQINASFFVEDDTFLLKHRFLLVYIILPERGADPSLSVDYSMPRNVDGIRKGSQGPTDCTSSTGVTQISGDLPVGRYLSRRDHAHYAVDMFKEAVAHS